MVLDDDTLDEDFAEQVRDRWREYNSSALARIRGIQQQGLASILAILFGGGKRADDKLDLDYSADDAYRLVVSFLREQQITPGFNENGFLRQYSEDHNLRDVVARIQEVSQEVDAELLPQRQFQGVVERLYSGGKKLIIDPASPSSRGLRVEIDGNPIPLQSLSSGEKQLLRLMLEVLAAGNGVVLIDEPELSMHVDWQLVLVESMRLLNPGCQFILATHSPEVMAEISGDFVFEL